MDAEESKTNELHRLLFHLSDNNDLRGSHKLVFMSKFSIY